MDRAPVTDLCSGGLKPDVRTKASSGDGLWDGASLHDLRSAARRADRAQARSGASHARQALELWQALVHGHCSMVDSFEGGGRRFVLAKQFENRPRDWRGLTAQERRIVAHAARGESRKVTGHRLGLSRSRVSSVLCSAMRKLGVRTQAQLVLLMRGFQEPVRAD